MATTTQMQQFPVMTSGDDPNIPADILALAQAIEKRVVGVYNNISDRDAKVTSPEEGMFAYMKDTDLLVKYNGSGWVAAFPTVPTFTSSTTVPSNGTGVNGDVHFKV